MDDTQRNVSLVTVACVILGTLAFLALALMPPDPMTNPERFTAERSATTTTSTTTTSTTTTAPRHTGSSSSLPVVVPPTTTTTTVPAIQAPTVPMPDTRPAVAGGSCAGWGELIAQHWPSDQVTKACAVMLCESGGDPTAANPRSTASGLFQFLDGTWRSARGMVPGASQYARAMHAPPHIQVHVAAEWWAATSWSQWECA